MIQITFYKLLVIFLPLLFFFSCSLSDKTLDENKKIVNSFYKNGSLEYQSEQKNGVLHGKSTYWFENGFIKSETIYDFGKIHNYHKEFYNNGELKYIIDYSYGKKNGFERWYYKNGQIKSEKKYNNNIIIGNVIRWDKNGNIIY